MASEASQTEFALLTIGNLKTNAIILLLLEEPFFVVTVPACNSVGAISLMEKVIACTIQLASFFMSFNIVAVPAELILAYSSVEEFDANSDFIGEFFSVHSPLVLLHAFSVEHLITTIAHNVAGSHVLFQSRLVGKRLVTLVTTDECWF